MKRQWFYYLLIACGILSVVTALTGGLWEVFIAAYLIIAAIMEHDDNSTDKKE